MTEGNMTSGEAEKGKEWKPTDKAVSSERTGEIRPLTHGEFLVGITFNPGGHPAVDDIKRKAADLIDAINYVESAPYGSPEHQREVARCKATAITNVEQGAMWAVKAATKSVSILQQ